MKSSEIESMPLGSAQRKVYSVTEINRKARVLLEESFANVWVEGEISNFKRHSSGHFYFSLKDETSQISAVFFSRFNQVLRFDPKDGLKVIAFGKISLYEARGQYQLYIERLEPKGLGELQLAFLQLKEKLEKEGLFDATHKKPIPKFPQVIGVITSPTGAAIRDILNVIGRRFQSVQVLIYPVRVQGDGAAEEIVQAIRDMHQAGRVDVLIVGRGGGSIEDLWCFNEEIVARAVYGSKIPVISAVGHEIDWTIIDFVADLRAPTPSAAAELVVQNCAELETRVEDYTLRMKNAIMNFISMKVQLLKTLQASYAFKQPLLLIDQFSQRLDELLRQLGNYLKAFVSDKRHRFDGVAGKLHALSPLAILERGYSLSFDGENHLLKDVRKIKIGDMLTTRLSRGVVKSKVTHIENKENPHDD